MNLRRIDYRRRGQGPATLLIPADQWHDTFVALWLDPEVSDIH